MLGAVLVGFAVASARSVPSRAQQDAIAIERDLRQVAALPGEPRVVSAAAVTQADAPLLTLENASTFEPTATRRLVIVGDERGSRAVVDAVRWFKTDAPREIREKWVVSALPAAGADVRSVRHWVFFQAPDLVVDVRGGEEEKDSLAAALAADPAAPGGVPIKTVAVREGDGAALARRITAESGDLVRSPLHDEILKRVARDPIDVARVLAKRYPQTPSISYIPAVAWVNTLRVASATGDASLAARVREQTRPWTSGEKKLFGEQVSLTAVAGTIIFAELARLDGNAEARALAIAGAEFAVRQNAAGVPEHGKGWTEDMFMTAAVLARTAGLPGRERDLDAAVRLLTGYAARLQRPDGIFVHATEGPIAWGRGNGFAALGLMEALTALPDGHDGRRALLEVYRRHMAGVKEMQAPDGAWRQIIDEPGAYREETATAMLLAAMARGVRLKWIDDTYAPVVRHAWQALAARVALDGTLVDVCAGTGAGPTKRYYLDRPAITGADDRGGAMALLAAVEMVR